MSQILDAMKKMRVTKQRLRKIPDLLLRSLGALEIIALNCFLMVWTGIQLVGLMKDPMIALLPIIGFGFLTFLLVRYFLEEPDQKLPP